MRRGKSTYSSASRLRKWEPKSPIPQQNLKDAVKRVNKAMGKNGWSPEYYPTEHYVNQDNYGRFMANHWDNLTLK